MTEENKQEQWPETFDHTKAYEENGPMAELLEPLFRVAEQHGCPVILTACVRNNEDTSRFIHMYNKRGDWMPRQFMLAEAILRLDNKDQQLIEIIVNLIYLASANQEQLNEAANNVAAMLRGANDADGVVQGAN